MVVIMEEETLYLTYLVKRRYLGVILSQHFALFMITWMLRMLL